MKTKLPGLNGLRAFAASFVLFNHVFQIAGESGDQSSLIFFKKHELLGTEMVNLFFVISGFIITYILYSEKAETGRISLKNFYIKRILRIWPLYFGLIVIAFLVGNFTSIYSAFPALNNAGLLILVLFLVTFFPAFPDPHISVLPHYWSLSVEEQFYIFWPPVFRRLKGKKVLFFCLLVIVLIILARNAMAYLVSYYHYSKIRGLLTILNLSMFGSIATGIAGAWLLVNNNHILGIIFNKFVQAACWLVLLCSILFSFFIPYVHYEVMACVCLVLILNVTSNKNTLLSLESKFLDKGFLCLQVLRHFFHRDIVISNCRRFPITVDPHKIQFNDKG